MLLALTFAASAGWLVPSNSHYDQNTYVSIPLELMPLKPLLKKAEALNGSPLKTRGEAHLTVVTPPEWEKLSAVRRAGLLENLGKSKIELRPKCLGVGAAGTRKTYFVVVVAPALAKLRRRFGLTEAFYPHVTLGFTDEDLHVRDGVIKDARTCRQPL